jgi:hypothetical protein
MDIAFRFIELPVSYHTAPKVPRSEEILVFLREEIGVVGIYVRIKVGGIADSTRLVPNFTFISLLGGPCEGIVLWGLIQPLDQRVEAMARYLFWVGDDFFGLIPVNGPVEVRIRPRFIPVIAPRRHEENVRGAYKQLRPGPGHTQASNSGPGAAVRLHFIGVCYASQHSSLLTELRCKYCT